MERTREGERGRLYGPETDAADGKELWSMPAIAIDQHGFVADVNAAADVVFDDDIKIKDRRLFIRNPNAGSTSRKPLID